MLSLKRRTSKRCASLERAAASSHSLEDTAKHESQEVRRPKELEREALTRELSAETRGFERLVPVRGLQPSSAFGARIRRGSDYDERASVGTGRCGRRGPAERCMSRRPVDRASGRPYTPS